MTSVCLDFNGTVVGYQILLYDQITYEYYFRAKYFCILLFHYLSVYENLN